MLMQSPFTALVQAVAAAIAALPDYWGETDNKLRLMQNNPSISSTTVVGDLLEADFGGYAAKTATAGAAVVNDPLTGNILLRIPDIAGGWDFLTSGTTNLPQTIYGAYVTDAAGAILLGAVKFPTPIVLTATAQIVQVDDLNWVLTNPPLGA